MCCGLPDPLLGMCACPFTAKPLRCSDKAEGRQRSGGVHQPQPLRHGATRPAFRLEVSAFCAARPAAVQPTSEPLTLQRNSAACFALFAASIMHQPNS